MKDHSKLWSCIGIILFGVLYSIILFAIKKDLSLAEWILYGFTILSLLITLIWSCVQGGHTKDYPMFDLPLTKIIFTYTFFQVLLGGVIGMILPLPSESIVLAIEIVAFVIFIIILVVFNSNTSSIRRIDETDYINVSRIRGYTASAQSIRNLLKDPDLVAKADQMVEVFEYADPSHTKESKGYEDRIENNLKILREDIESGDLSNVSDRMDIIINIERERADVIRACKK